MYLWVRVILGGETWVHKTNLITPLFIGVPVLSHESELSYLCLLGYRFLLKVSCHIFVCKGIDFYWKWAVIFLFVRVSISTESELSYFCLLGYRFLLKVSCHIFVCKGIDFYDFSIVVFSFICFILLSEIVTAFIWVHFIQSLILTCLVPCYDVRYDFRIYMCRLLISCLCYFISMTVDGYK